MKLTLLSAAVMCVAIPALADVTVRFEESAPKDRFTITNDGPCPMGEVAVVIDLGASAAGLIFDVTGTGAGVSVFQPMELVRGQEYLSGIPEVRDGDSKVTLGVVGLGAGDSIAFTIDVDDTLGSSETMVSGAEISGAKIMVTGHSVSREATFGDDATAQVALNSCNA